MQVLKDSYNLPLQRNINQLLNSEEFVDTGRTDTSLMHHTASLCNTSGFHLVQSHWPVMNNYNKAVDSTTDHWCGGTEFGSVVEIFSWDSSTKTCRTSVSFGMCFVLGDFLFVFTERQC